MARSGSPLLGSMRSQSDVSETLSPLPQELPLQLQGILCRKSFFSEHQNRKSPLFGSSSCPLSGYSTCLGLGLDLEGGRVAALGAELMGAR